MGSIWPFQAIGNWELSSTSNAPLTSFSRYFSSVNRGIVLKQMRVRTMTFDLRAERRNS